MGCIGCKTVMPPFFKNEKFQGKARVPGIPKKLRESKAKLFRKKIPKEITPIDINMKKTRILQQLEDENIIAKRALGGVAYTLEEEMEKPKPVPARLLERLDRPSTSMGFNSEEREIMAESLKNDSLEEKRRLARLSEERRMIAEINRERALKWKAYKLEMKLKMREEKIKKTKEEKEKMTLDASMRTYEKQQQAKYRRNLTEMERKDKEKELTKVDLKPDFRSSGGMPEID